MYMFSGLDPGDYKILFVLPECYSFSPHDQTGDTMDSDADPDTGMTQCTTLEPGENDMTWDAGMYLPTVGCTYTQGYWKTHSKYGPAPDDETWALVEENGENSLFFNTGQTWYKVLWTQPRRGNAYYILAHQYIAAHLNVLNGADTSDITDELEHAEDLLDQYDGNPKSMANIRGFIRYDFIRTAEVLDDYNNGDIGPGHCDDEDKET